MQVDRQEKRTSLVPLAAPVWDEVMAFKAVPIDADLKLSVYGRSRVRGQTLFLGELVVPLREVRPGSWFV